MKSLQINPALQTPRVLQDKKVPLLINREDGRLMPNVPRIRELPEYIPYTGSVTASATERMRWLDQFNKPQMEAPFDVGTATKDELIDFAATEYGRTLDRRKNVDTLRAEVMAMAGDDHIG